MPSRLDMTMRNAFWSYVSMIISFIVKFVSRTVFIYYLGKEYLGVNGLFFSILGVLSFAELGIGTAINFSLYKPVAEKNIEKIKAYMHCYKWAYRIIALIITLAGLALVPFLHSLVKDPGDVGNITVYYLIFLFNTVTSYFVSYKFSLVNAEQKNYIFTNVNLIVSTTTTIIQLVAIVLWQNYLFYLLVAAVIDLLQKIIANAYLNCLYPYLKDRVVTPLSQGEKSVLVTKVKAMFMHKIGDVCVHQTDNIIISSFVNIGTVGLLSNYNLLSSTVCSCISILFHSVTGSLGNLIATESPQRQYEIFKVYRFIGFWFYGFSAIALYVLSTPFINLWIGEQMVVDDIVIALILIDYYMIGHRVCLTNFKMAGGIFEQDKYVAILQAVVNLFSSIALVKWIGLPGVFIGTLLQGSIASVVKPHVVYKYLFHTKTIYYFIDSFKYLVAIFASLFFCLTIRYYAFHNGVTISSFVLMMFIVGLIPNACFVLCFFRTREFKYTLEMGKRIIHRNRK